MSLLLLGALVLGATFLLSGCQAKDKETEEESYTTKEIEEELQTEKDPGNLVVEGAIVMCTSFSGDKSNSCMKKNDDTDNTNGGAELNHKDTDFDPEFDKCLYSDDETCLAEIENEEWQDYDVSKETGDGGYALIKEESYMFCTNGCGMIYITDDGQRLDNMEVLGAGIIIDRWWNGEYTKRAIIENALSVLEKNGDLSRVMPYINMEQLISLASPYANISLFMLVDLNRVMDKYDINTLERIRHFLAQCMHETDYFQFFVENNYGDESYYATLRYFPYIGAGGIHLTFEYGYQAFAIYLALLKYPQLKGKVNYLNPNYTGGNGEIGIEYENLKSVAREMGLDISEYIRFVETDKPYEQISEEYAWESAGYFWDSNGINEKVDSFGGGTNSSNVDVVSKVVNQYDTDSFGKRQIAYEDTIGKIK